MEAHMSMLENFSVPDLATVDLARPNLTLDTGGIEAKLQSINNSTQLWALPALPDVVKLDLASYGGFGASPINEFITGLASDIAAQTTTTIAPPSVDTTAFTNATNTQVAQAVSSPLPQAPPNVLFAPEDDFSSTFQTAFTKLAGISGPKRLATDSVVSMKAEAIKRGLIPADTPLDGSWGRQWNGVRSELMNEQFREVLAGDRPLGMPISGDDGVMGLLNKWASPTGLIGLATQLDFIPDFKQVASETEQWGNKWRRWWQNKTSPRDFIDAVTGPIDDVAFPIINTALLFTGVSGVVTYGRAVGMGSRLNAAAQAGRGISMFAGVTGLPTTGARILGTGARAFDVAAEVKRMQQASLIATRLQKAGGIAGQLGAGLEKWRQLSSTVLMKKAVQSGMKVGFAGRVEEFLLPDRQLGIGLTGETGGTTEQRAATFDDWWNRKIDNPWSMAAYSVAEVALSPTNIFKQGSIVGPLKSGTNRMLDAVVGTTNDRYNAVSFVTAAAEQIRATNPKRADEILSSVRAGKGKQALIDIYGGGDEWRAGKVVNWLQYNAALNSYARKEAALAIGEVHGPAYERAFRAFRMSALNQARGADFDLDTEFGRDAYRALASKIAAVDEAPTAAAARRKKIWDDLAEIHEETPEGLALRARAKTDLEQHAKVRQGTFKDLMEGLEPEDLAREIGDAWPTIDNWDAFESSMRQLEDATAFAPDGAVLRSVQDIRTGEFAHPLLMDDLGDMINNPKFTGRPLEWFDRTKAQMQEGRGRLTVARKDAVTAGAIEAYIDQINWLKARQVAIGMNDVGVTGLPLNTERWGQGLGDYANSVGKAVADLDANDIKAWIKDTPSIGGLRSVATQWAETVTWTARNGVDHMDAHGFLTRKLDELQNNDTFWSRAGVEKWNGPQQYTLDEKVKKLQERIEFVAKDVVVDPELAARLDAAGYKPVFGSDFTVPTDIMDLAGPLPEIKRLDLARKSLGTFVGHDRSFHTVQAQMRRDRFDRLIPAVLKRQLDNGVDIGPRGVDIINDPTNVGVQSLWKDLQAEARRIVEANNEAARVQSQAGFLTSLFGRAGLTGMPSSPYRMSEKQIRAALGEGLSDAGIKAVVGALLRAQNTGWEYRGLLTLEDAMVSNSWLRGGLKALSGHTAETDFAAWARTAGVGPKAIRPVTATLAQPLQAFREMDFANKHRLAYAIAGTGIALQSNEQMGGDNPFVAGAVGAATGAVMGPRIVNPRNVIRAYAAFQAQSVAMGAGVEDQNQRIGIALGAGLLAGTGAKRGASKAIHFLDNKGWAEYSRLGRTARVTRDRLRFALNPIWDAQRYTEGITQAVMADLPPGVTLPVTARPMQRLLRDYPGLTADDATRHWREASGHIWDHDTLDSMQDWFSDRGIMGFSPTEWHAAAFGQLTRQGMDEVSAVAAVEKAFLFGMRRSGLESSVNFVFFPFSFQKHLVGNMARFAAQDMGRVTLMHDSIKVWDALNERYDLPERWRAHLPILSQVRKFNPFAYGITPGEFGGVNRATYEAFKRLDGVNEAHDAVANAFLPQGMHVNTESGFDNWQSYKGKVQRLLPIWREAEDMYQEVLVEQLHTFGSEEHISKQTEIDRGWAEHGKLNDSINEMLRSNGLEYSKVMRAEQGSALFEVKQLIQDQRYALETKYPAWRRSKEESTLRAVERNSELRKIINSPQDDVEANAADFASQLDFLSGVLGFNVETETEQLTAEQFDTIRRTAISKARQTPGFQTIYRAYYQRLFGPIEKELR